MRTAANAPQAGIKAAHAALPGCVGIGQAHAACVVEMCVAQSVAYQVQGLVKQAGDRSRIGVADGVGQADAVGAGIQQFLQQA
ncbi:hypothetical protein D3C72_1112780 [compost metagenome]